MNELVYNFLNQIDDPNKIKEMTVEEFAKLVKDNKLISEEDGKLLIESFKKILSKKGDTDDTSDSDQRKKKYRDQHKQFNQETIEKKENTVKEKSNEEKSLERD